MGSESGRMGFPPPHPGEYLKEDILPALGMSVKELAEHLGVSRQTLSEVVNGNRSVSTHMAIRLGRAFENGARFWMALQAQYDLWNAERGFSADVAPLRRKHEAA